MRDRETIQKELRKIQKDIREIKAYQISAGDSWVLYAVDGSFTISTGQKVRIDYIPDTSGPFLCNIYKLEADFYSDGSVFYHDWTRKGRSYYQGPDFSHTVDFVINSTKKGTVQITYM